MTTQPSVLFRCDAGVGIGLGHVMRCLALAQELVDRGVAVRFAVRELPPSTRARLAAEGCVVDTIAGAPGGVRDAEETLSLVTAHRASWVVVDGYAFGVDYQRRLRGAGARLLWIDDLGELGEYAVDLLLNQNLHGRQSHYFGRAAADARLLLGPSYTLIRRELRRAADGPRVPRPRTALLAFGGADPDGLTLIAMEALSDERLSALHAVALVGPATPADPVHARAEALGGRARVVVDPPEMATLLRGADLCVSAAGSIMWELALFGVPSAFVVAAANQRENARCAADLGSCMLIGAAGEVGPRQLADALAALDSDVALRSRLTATARGMVDGRGAGRVADAMLGVTVGG
ncbi:MAG: UDP-2,4-diacetamido-2,4,6-trideoxy-beta-L-altropyranose hydrolase [Planctomycetota bacterium]|nr:UDP-2,4-diacetamido-2,4,6-trideoxy-beta-L-altropyranose hydrolase [Planctomycetota bacterium]